jgi:hypothetical protein
MHPKLWSKEWDQYVELPLVFWVKTGMETFECLKGIVDLC